MFNNVSITKDGKKDIIDISGKRFNQVTELSETDLARLLKINSELFQFYTNWYLLHGKLFYFKTDFIFNEIFLSELAQEFNVKCVQFMLAKDGKNVGIISGNFRKKTFNYYDYMEFCNLFFGEFPRNIESFKTHLYSTFDKETADKLMEQIFSLIAFDFFSGQNDRTHINVTFEEKDHNVVLAPMCDNGVAFHMGDFNTYVACFDNLTFPYDNIIDPSQLYLLRLIRENVVFYNKLSKALDINIRDVLERTLEKYKIRMSTLEKIKVNDFFGAKCDVIERALAYSKKI